MRITNKKLPKVLTVDDCERYNCEQILYVVLENKKRLDSLAKKTHSFRVTRALYLQKVMWIERELNKLQVYVKVYDK